MFLSWALLNELATEETISAIALSDRHCSVRIIERRDLLEGLWLVRVDPGGPFPFTAAELPWFKFVATISRQWEDAAWKGETGRVDDLVRNHADVWKLRPETTTAYLGGHPSMCENGQGIVQSAGWQKGSMFEEVYFRPAKDASAE